MGQYISTVVLKQAMGRQLRSLWSKSRNYAGFGDEEYYLPSVAEVQALLAQIAIAPAALTQSWFDCDDYAFVLKGLMALASREQQDLRAAPCIGVAWGKFSWMGGAFHACNWFVDDGGELLWLEPQTMGTFDLPQCLELNLLVV
jgi:hypothetical protein